MTLIKMNSNTNSNTVLDHRLSMHFESNGMTVIDGNSNLKNRGEPGVYSTN